MKLDYVEAKRALLTVLEQLQQNDNPTAAAEVLHHLHVAYRCVRPGTLRDDTGEPFGELKPREFHPERFKENSLQATDRVKLALEELELLLDGDTGLARRNEVADLVVQAYELL